MEDLYKKIIIVGGISVNVFSRQGQSSSPPSILFFLHGRSESAEKYEPRVHQLFSNLHSITDETNCARALIVITFVNKPGITIIHLNLDRVALYYRTNETTAHGYLMKN
jgi:hypothetical protein